MITKLKPVELGFEELKSGRVYKLATEKYLFIIEQILKDSDSWFVRCTRVEKYDFTIIAIFEDCFNSELEITALLPINNSVIDELIAHTRTYQRNKIIDSVLVELS